MSTAEIVTLTVLIFTAALLYSSVGHGGGSGYLAAMAIVGVIPAIMKPTALTLNIVVAAIASIKFLQAKCFSWSIFWPFAITSIPLSFLGGSIKLQASVYKLVVGLILLYTAYRFWFISQKTANQNLRPIPLWAALFAGSAIGLISGLIGVGGGIFLSPLLLLMGWAEIRHTSGVAAVFILVNSIAGLIGHVSKTAYIPLETGFWAVAAAIGGWTGSHYGSQKFGNLTIGRLLAIVLVIAGLKLIFI
ncbi:MAG: sulfite exporter TauE/SafE family protein [Elusimicrobia bacterium]|nr:sulfite exporter TauE/SafE family protein [Elusimicrobiota bacterium]